MTLQQQLEKKAKQSKQNIPESAQKTMQSAQEELENSGLLEKCLGVGDSVPEFVLRDQDGHEISMHESLEDGPIILNFYRGGWCPYCNVELAALQKHLEDFHQLGAALIAITPQNPDESQTDKKRHNLGFTILSDNHNTVAEKFGLVYELSEELVQTYKELGLDIEKHNGEGETRLPLAATYVVDTQGIIQYAYVTYDYRTRAEPKEILHAVQEL